MPVGAGWHNSFWLMAHDGSGGTNPKASGLELDICENDSKNNNGYQVNVHRWRGAHLQKGTKWIPTPNLSGNFHIWACLYTEQEVKYYFDGKLVQTVGLIEIPNTPVNIWFTTIASMLGGTKQVDDDNLPAALDVDYVRYYRTAGIKQAKR